MTNQLTEILDFVFDIGFEKHRQIADGKGANTYASDRMLEAKKRLQALIQRERTAAAIEELETLGREWQTGIDKYKSETASEWQYRVSDYVLDRIAALKAAEGRA